MELQLLKTFRDDTVSLVQPYHLGINPQGLFFFISKEMITQAKEAKRPFIFTELFEVIAVTTGFRHRIIPDKTNPDQEIEIEIQTYLLNITDYLRVYARFGINFDHKILLLQSIDLQRKNPEYIPPKQNLRKTKK